jgi:hypothetical protein
LEDESWRRNLGGGIMEETSERLLRSIWRPLEGIWRHPGDTQETPRKHPGGTQRRPESPRRHP